MITKIEIDGKEQFAILLGENDSLEDISLYSYSLIAMIREASRSELLPESAMYFTTQLLDHLAPSIEQMMNLQGAHFGATRKVTPTTPEPCKIWR